MKEKGFHILPHIKLNNLSSFDFIVIGVFIFTLTNSLLIFYLPQYIWWGLDSISVLFFLLGLFMSHRISQVDADIIACAICMIVYAIVLLFVSIINLEINFPHLITQQAYFLPYLFPFLILIGIKPEYFQKIYQYLYLGCFLALLFLFSKSYNFIFNTSEVFGKMHEDADSTIWGGLYFWLSMVIAGCPFYMAISIYYMAQITKGNYHKLVIVLTIFISIVFALSFGRRMAALSGILFLFSPLLIKVLFNRNQKKYLFILVFLCLFIYFFFSEIIELFPFLENRLDNDTRGGLIDDLIIDFNIGDWFWGRGLDATYRSPSGLGGDSIRNMVESGYLDIILHAGLVYLFLFVYIMLRSIYLGMFKSKNIIVKSAGLYLLIHLIMMCTQDRPYFSLDYMMIYIAICICGCRKWRQWCFDSKIYLESCIK